MMKMYDDISHAGILPQPPFQLSGIRAAAADEDTGLILDSPPCAAFYYLDIQSAYNARDGRYY